MSLFLFGNNFYKNRQAFKIFSPQLLEVYRILLVETALESIVFYYTFSVINAVFVSYTALLYDSTAATRTLKFSTTLLSIFYGIHLISPLMSSLVCGLFSQTLSFRYPSENSQAVSDLGNRMTRDYLFDAKCVCPIWSYAWGIQAFCSVWEMSRHLFSRTEHLNASDITSHETDSSRVKPINPSHPICKISNRKR